MLKKTFNMATHPPTYVSVIHYTWCGRFSSRFATVNWWTPVPSRLPKCHQWTSRLLPILVWHHHPHRERTKPRHLLGQPNGSNLSHKQFPKLMHQTWNDFSKRTEVKSTRNDVFVLRGKSDSGLPIPLQNFRRGQ